MSAFKTWLNGLTSKTTPVDADQTYLRDSVTGNSYKLTWANLKATAKTYFDTLYAAVSHTHAASDIASGTVATARLGSGTADSTVFLRGDQTWAAPAGGSPGGSGTELQYRNAGAFGAMAGTAWDDTNRALTMTGSTVTTSNPILNLSQTWNAGGVTFVGQDSNVTNTASASGSLLERWRVNGYNYFAIRKDGVLEVGGFGSASTAAIKIGYGTSSGYTFDTGLSNTNGTELNVICSGVGVAQFNSSKILTMTSVGMMGFSSSSTLAAGVTSDTAIGRNAAGIAEINSGTASAYRDLKLRNLIGTGNLATGIVAKTANYTATANDGTIEVDASGGAVTITLPAASGTGGRIFAITKTDSSGNAVTVDGNASETINGATTVSLASQYSTVIIQANTAGTAWIKLATI